MWGDRKGPTIQQAFCGLLNEGSRNKVQNNQEAGLHLRDGLGFMRKGYLKMLKYYIG